MGPPSRGCRIGSRPLLFVVGGVCRARYKRHLPDLPPAIPAIGFDADVPTWY